MHQQEYWCCWEEHDARNDHGPGHRSCVSATLCILNAAKGQLFAGGQAYVVDVHVELSTAPHAALWYSRCNGADGSRSLGYHNDLTQLYVIHPPRKQLG